MRVNAEKIAQTAYTMMAVDDANLDINFDFLAYQEKCIRDTKLLINAVADNVEFGGNDAVYDAAKFYIDTIHLQGEEGQSVQVFNAAMEMCCDIMRNNPSGNNDNFYFISNRFFANNYADALSRNLFELTNPPSQRGSGINDIYTLSRLSLIHI